MRAGDACIVLILGKGRKLCIITPSIQYHTWLVTIHLIVLCGYTIKEWWSWLAI